MTSSSPSVIDLRDEDMQSNPAEESLLPTLLDLHARGRNPFLVRNLKYVKDDKNLTRRRIWSLLWADSSPHSANTPRHLVLTVRPSRCILERTVTAQLLHPGKSLSPYRSVNYVASIATLRICLCVKQQDGHYVSFGVRDITLRVWPREHLNSGVEIEDFSVAETFDLSAVLPVLGSVPVVLSLVMELWAGDLAAKPVNAYAPKLRGEVVIWDYENASYGPAIPNGYVNIPLQFTAQQHGQGPASRAIRSVTLENAVRQTALIEHQGSSNKMPRQDDLAGSLVLQLLGRVEKALTEVIEKEKPRVYATLSYSSQEVPYWDGIVRHDFICPWCHRNCHRFRTLLAHFQVEHDQMKFSFQGIRPHDRSDDMEIPASVPFLLKFEVQRVNHEPVEIGSKKRKKANDKNLRSSTVSNDTLEDVYANPKRYGSYMGAVEKPSTAEEEVDAAMKKITINGGNVDSDSASTEFDDDRDRNFFSMVQDELGNNCKHCLRSHNKSYNGKANFCSEWCEIIYRKELTEGSSSGQRSARLCGPLSNHASVPRHRKFNYKETLGKLKLYHVVSVCEAKEEHFEEDDPDSEEEVDHSWRLALSLEKIRHLEGVSPKEKILWMMWNRFAHENYPIPSVYAERYTRYTCELFALEVGSQIARLKLRVHFFGFLRALHIHGLIDSKAIISILLCLDGKKKRRDCSISSRPELPQEDPNTIGKGKGAGKGRKGKKRG